MEVIVPAKDEVWTSAATGNAITLENFSHHGHFNFILLLKSLINCAQYAFFFKQKEVLGSRFIIL